MQSQLCSKKKGTKTTPNRDTRFIRNTLAMKVLFLTSSLGKKFILPVFRLDALVLLRAILGED